MFFVGCIGQLTAVERDTWLLTRMYDEGVVAAGDLNGKMRVTACVSVFGMWMHVCTSDHIQLAYSV